MACDMKRDLPLVSVVIPVFNRAWQLQRALSSLQDQTYKNFEVIVSDDGSTEDIAAVVEEFRGTLNICLLKAENFGGPARPRNLGIQNAKGNWIAFLDCDDYWYKNKLELQSKGLEGKDYILGYAGINEITMGGGLIRGLRPQHRSGYIFEKFVFVQILTIQLVYVYF